MKVCSFIICTNCPSHTIGKVVDIYMYIFPFHIIFRILCTILSYIIYRSPKHFDEPRSARNSAGCFALGPLKYTVPTPRKKNIVFITSKLWCKMWLFFQFLRKFAGLSVNPALVRALYAGTLDIFNENPCGIAGIRVQKLYFKLWIQYYSL